MKVLFLVSGNNKLGVSPFIESQADSLLTLGIDLKIFKVEGKGLFSYFKAVFKLRKILSIHNFDLIHCHYGLCGWVWFFGARKIPSVLSLMGSDVYGTFENKNKNFTDYFLILSTKLICFFVSHIIVKSKNLYHDLPSYVTKKTSIIPNGVNFS
jgi:teichuronic acid biosynthesis glycosyltransferase TuaC